MIANESIEKLRERLDIVDIISHFIEVRKQGASFVALCPFHDDKSPSMHINAQKNFFHCFACKAGGDAFKFVMDFEKLSFADAVEKIANLSNFTLTYTKEKNENKRDLKHILPIFNAFFKQNLKQNKFALDYLYNRGLNDEDIIKFELGFAPSNEESLRLLKNEKIPLEDAVAAGIVKKEKEIYASFIKRISFAIYDYKNTLVGFGGRTMDSSNPAKYVNSPQCFLFDKSRILYAFHLAKEAILAKKEMIICEGYMDAIFLHKAGFNNAVAVLGTALGENHLPLIKRYANRVILCFDSDAAGVNAALRSAFLLSVHKIDGKVALLKGGKDPAELVASKQTHLLKQTLDEAIDMIEFYLRKLLERPLNSALEKQNALEEVQKFTFLLEPLVAQAYTTLVADILGVKEEFIKLAKTQKKESVNFNLNLKNDNKNIVELEILAFLKTNEKAREKFAKISDKACFKNANLLEKILLNLGIEDSQIRELELQNYRKINDENEFLLGICKINLAFLNQIFATKAFQTNLNLAYKKQLFAILEQNSAKLIKNLTHKELNAFLTQILMLLKSEKNTEILENLLKKFNKIFKNARFDYFDLINSKNQNENEPF